MLIACRLAGLSALEGHYADDTAQGQSGASKSNRSDGVLDRLRPCAGPARATATSSCGRSRHIVKSSLTATSHLRPLHGRTGWNAMGSLSLGEAAEKAGTSKVDIWRAIREGRLSAQRTDDGGFAVDPAELFRVFETQRSEQPAMEQDAGAATEASGQSETSAAPETAETNNVAVAFAALGAELQLSLIHI